MLLHTSNKDYEVEFTFEAAESEIVQTVFDYFSGSYMLKGINTAKPESEMTDDELIKTRSAQMDAVIGGVSAVPKLSIDLLYMGLLEAHGNHSDGDKSILCRDDAKRVYKQFCKENPDDEKAKQSGLFDALKKQMEEDGFFDRIGLTQFMEMMRTEEPQEKVAKIPQDHKKKSTKPSSNG